MLRQKTQGNVDFFKPIRTLSSRHLSYGSDILKLIQS